MARSGAGSADDIDEGQCGHRRHGVGLFKELRDQAFNRRIIDLGEVVKLSMDSTFMKA